MHEKENTVDTTSISPKVSSIILTATGAVSGSAS